MTEPPPTPPPPAATAQPTWKRDLAILTAGVMVVAAAAIAWRITHPPPPPTKLATLPLRLLGAPQHFAQEEPRALAQAEVRCEAVDSQHRSVGDPQAVSSDQMGAVNLPYRPGCALHVTIGAPGFATRELWLEHPETLHSEAPDWLLTLERSEVGPREIPLWVGLKSDNMYEPPVPIGNIAMHFTVDPPVTDPRKPATTATPRAPAQTPVTDAGGRAVLTWLPNRGGTLQIEVPGCRPLKAHLADCFDFQRRFPGGLVVLEALDAGAARP